ncbi:hypothetical protein SEA_SCOOBYDOOBYDOO_176 [Mycobacterium phage ScoobyDoobyDoo]|nr:hypothetical protein SEA_SCOOBYDOOBYDOO_176 [Mycobacterium phage ScoobyDoobyDoo]
MTNSLVEQDLKAVLAAAGGDYVQKYDAIVAAADNTAVEATKTSREMRKERWKKAIAKLDRKELATANKTFTGFMKLLRRNAPIVDVDEPTRLSEQEATDLMEAFLELQRVEEVAKATREQYKTRVMEAMTAQFAEEGEEFPEQVNASIDVPSLGYRFAREGCGRKDPELDEEKLAALLGDDLWERVSTEEVVIKRHVSYEALMREAEKDSEILEHIRTALKVGQFKSPRFVVRPI